MNILVACEFSGIVRDAFKSKGVRVRKARETIVHPDAYYVRFKACDSLSRIVRNNAKKVVAA